MNESGTGASYLQRCFSVNSGDSAVSVETAKAQLNPSIPSSSLKRKNET